MQFMWIILHHIKLSNISTSCLLIYSFHIQLFGNKNYQKEDDAISKKEEWEIYCSKTYAVHKK